MAENMEKNRSLMWEDDVPAEPRVRRVRAVTPATGRGLPGMPLEPGLTLGLDSADGDESPRLGTKVRLGGQRSEGGRFDQPRRPWWRPRGTLGRVALGFGLLSVVGGLAAGGYALKSWFGHDGRFRIAGTGNIEAAGLTEVSRAEMLPVFGEDIGRNIFFVPLDARRKQLEEIPWVERATVMRLLPDQIRVSIVERKPVAFVRQGQQIGLVDANGVLLTMPAAMMAQRHYSFPVVTGIAAHDSQEQRKTRMKVYARLLAELDANGQRFSEQLSEIDLSDAEDARVLMPEQGADILAHFGEDHFLERYERYKAHIAEWRQQYPKLATVDLRYDQQVVLDMTPASSTTDGAASDATVASGGASGGNSADAQASTTTPVAEAKADVKPVVEKKVAVTSGKSASALKRVKAANKAGSRSRKITARDRKKRADTRRAKLELRQRKSTSTTRAPVVATQGQ
jgi:cell division protein FtsQ